VIIRPLTAAASAILLTSWCNTTSAQTITGRVVDGDTNAQVVAAEIMLVQIDSSARTISDAKGAFRFRAIPGMWTLRVNALGYDELITQPLEVAPNEHLSIVVMLTAKPLELPPVTVIARSNRAFRARGVPAAGEAQSVRLLHGSKDDRAVSRHGRLRSHAPRAGRLDHP
jgi:hypothetical protein